MKLSERIKNHTWATEVEALESELASEKAAREAAHLCTTCGGESHPSGITCVCEGTGRIADEILGLRNNAIAERIGRENAEQRFEDHTTAVAAFLSEMRCTMIDPLAEGEIKIKDACAELLQAARDQREYQNKAEQRIADLRAALAAEGKCATCDGTGVMGGICEDCSAASDNPFRECGTCHGTGKWESQCAECDGSGDSFKTELGSKALAADDAAAKEGR